MNEKTKYYELFITGEIQRDAQKNPLKNDDGTIKVKYQRTTLPSEDLKKAGLGPQLFFQTELVEVNVEADTLKTATRTFKIGPSAPKGRTENVFKNKQREVFKAITTEIVAGNYSVIIPASAEEEPVIKIKDFALPGEIVEFDCGFEYYVHTRNKETKIMERLEANSYNDKGKLIKVPVKKRMGTIFLFGSETSAKDAHVAEAIAELKQYEVKAPGVNEKTEQVIISQEKVEPPVEPKI